MKERVRKLYNKNIYYYIQQLLYSTADRALLDIVH